MKSLAHFCVSIAGLFLMASIGFCQTVGLKLSKSPQDNGYALVRQKISSLEKDRKYKFLAEIDGEYTRGQYDTIVEISEENAMVRGPLESIYKDSVTTIEIICSTPKSFKNPHIRLAFHSAPNVFRRVEFIDLVTGENLLSNSAFEKGLSGWEAQGGIVELVKLSDASKTRSLESDLPESPAQINQDAMVDFEAAGNEYLDEILKRTKLEWAEKRDLIKFISEFTNYDFSSGDFSQWTVRNSGPYEGIKEIIDDPAAVNGKALYLQEYARGMTAITSVFRPTRGTQATARFFNPNGISSCGICVQPIGGKLIKLEEVGDPSYVTKVYDLSPWAGQEIEISFRGGRIQVDYLKIEIPMSPEGVGLTEAGGLAATGNEYLDGLLEKTKLQWAVKRGSAIAEIDKKFIDKLKETKLSLMKVDKISEARAYDNAIKGGDLGEQEPSSLVRLRKARAELIEKTTLPFNKDYWEKLKGIREAFKKNGNLKGVDVVDGEINRLIKDYSKASQ